MAKLELEDFDAELPNRMHVAVLMEKKPSSHPWADFSYDAIGVVVRGEAEDRRVTRVYQDDGIEHYLVSGMSLRLFEDECECYYHNLMSPEPGCFIVAGEPDEEEIIGNDGMPLPYLVSLSFDEVHAYLEGDEQIYSVPIPPELYRWAEAYVLTHYVAVKKTKRKLRNWRETERPAGPLREKRS